MKLLVIGGTSFVGRHITQQALENGHEVVLFNRGKTNPNIFQECRRILGDRRTQINQAALENWDAIIDTCGYTPNDMKPVVNALKEQTNHYVFVSTISVYDDYSTGYASENSSIFSKEILSDEVNGDTYGPLKALCEKEVQEGFGEHALIVRPCIIVGPHDPTDRFTYWAKRIVEEGPIAIPMGEREIQWIDVRDLASWIVKMIEEKRTGTFNAASQPIPYDKFIDELARHKVLEKVPISDEVIVKSKVDSNRNFPFWVPISKMYPQGFPIANPVKAHEFGLTIRPLQETAEDTRSWAGHFDIEKCKAGPSKAIEREWIDRMTEEIQGG